MTWLLVIVPLVGLAACWAVLFHAWRMQQRNKAALRELSEDLDRRGAARGFVIWVATCSDDDMRGLSWNFLRDEARKLLDSGRA